MSSAQAAAGWRSAAFAGSIPWRRHRSATLFGVLLVALPTVAVVGPLSLRTVWLGLSLALLLWLAALDLRERRVPNAIVYPALLFELSGAALLGPERALLAVAGGLLAFVVMLALALASRGAMGMGDVKVAALCGVLLGPGNALRALAFGSLLAAAVALALLATRRASLRDSLPLVPFLALSTLAIVIKA